MTTLGLLQLLLVPEFGAKTLDDLADLPIARCLHQSFMFRTRGLRHNVTACDAANLSLVEAPATPLVTRDALGTSAGHRACGERV